MSVTAYEEVARLVRLAMLDNPHPGTGSSGWRTKFRAKIAADYAHLILEAVAKATGTDSDSLNNKPAGYEKSE